MHKAVIYLFIFIFAIGCGGCAVVKHSEQIGTLQKYAASQADAQRYVSKQEKLFSVLSDDVKNNKLKKGASKNEILKTYGEPILSWEVEGQPMEKEVLLYRHPTNYFTSDKVYLYFDDKASLARWEYEPYKPVDKTIIQKLQNVDKEY